MTGPARDDGSVSSAERRRLFEDAQRQADTVFAQYQLSQLVALGGELPVLARSVIGELVRVTDAVAGALWLVPARAGHLQLLATEPDARSYPDVVAVPERFATIAEADTWVRPSGWHGVTLDERREIGDERAGSRTVGFIALRPPEGISLPPDRVRLLALVRHELAIAFRAAQLRETLKREQALLAAILDGANDGIVAVDESRRVVRVNRAAWSLLGGRRSDEPRTCRDLLGCAVPGGARTAAAPPVPDGDEALRCGPRCRFEEVLDGPAGIVDAELRIPRPDGTEIPVAASFSAMGGREPGAVAVLRDLRADLAAEELRSSFLAAVSHELRTPLALIGGYVDSLLALDLDPAAQRRSVERIGSAAGRLNILVDELLDLTRLEQASMGLHRARVDLAALLTAFTADLGETPGMPAIRLAVPRDLPPVDADALRIGHVLTNLVDNARKYAGPGEVTILAHRTRRHVVVTVADTGPGVPVEERALVFDRFYRGHAVRDAGIRGSGLGLYVCRRLVEAHGGQIWVEPEVGRSAISFSIPHARPVPHREGR